jgi:hypothetical protein
MADVLDYIERFYNPKRRHSTLDLSPMEFRSPAGQCHCHGGNVECRPWL